MVKATTTGRRNRRPAGDANSTGESAGAMSQTSPAPEAPATLPEATTTDALMPEQMPSVAKTPPDTLSEVAASEVTASGETPPSDKSGTRFEAVEETPEPQPQAGVDGPDSAAAGAPTDAQTDLPRDATPTDTPAEVPQGDAQRGASPPPVTPPPAPAQRRGILGPVIGGIVAAAIGAGAVLYLLPQGWQPAGTDLSGLEQRLSALETRSAPTADLGDLPDRVATLEALPAATPSAEVDLSPLTARLDALESAMAEAAPGSTDEPDLSPLLARLTALEDRPGVTSDDLLLLRDRIVALETGLPALVSDAVGSATADLRAELVGQAQDIAASAETLAAAQARAEMMALLGELGLAADTGAPAEATLDRLADMQQLPAALDTFRSGLPTLGALQAAYPPAARAALAAAPPPEGAGVGDRVATFLRNQTGARSLAPRDGMTTDAILSRAEAAVRGADLDAALTELDALPPAPAAAMAGWRTQVETRQAALAALADLSARLGQD
jgi:hypothetical protein